MSGGEQPRNHGLRLNFGDLHSKERLTLNPTHVYGTKGVFAAVQIQVRHSASMSREPAKCSGHPDKGSRPVGPMLGVKPHVSGTHGFVQVPGEFEAIKYIAAKPGKWQPATAGKDCGHWRIGRRAGGLYGVAAEPSIEPGCRVHPGSTSGLEPSQSAFGALIPHNANQRARDHQQHAGGAEPDLCYSSQ